MPDIEIVRVGADGWRTFREVRLAALADSPLAFASSHEVERGYDEVRWRSMTGDAAVFVAVTTTTVGVAVAVARDDDEERGLGAMWVAPEWRGRGVGTLLVDAVVRFARTEGRRRIGLWVPADHPEARRRYERCGFRATGRDKPFPGQPARVVREMRLCLG